MGLEIEIKGGMLDLPEDTELNIVQTNPLISTQGTYTLPILLPDSTKNIKLLNCAAPMHSTYKPTIKHDTMVRRGAFQKKASLVILSPDSEDGIDCTLLMNESEMYAKMTETTLSSAFKIRRTASEFLQGQSFPSDLDRLIRYLELVASGYYKDDFLFFQAALESRTVSVNYANPNGNDNLSDFNLFEFINRMEYTYDENIDINLPPKEYPGSIKFQGRDNFNDYVGGEKMELPKGYGICPFLRLSYVLRRIYAFFGYDLKESLFDTHPDMSIIVVVNNTADAVVTGSIDYSQLVPDGTIDSFLNDVRALFGCEFVLLSDNRSVEVQFYKDKLKDMKMVKDYTPFLTGKARTQYTNPKTVKLTLKRSLDSTSVPFDTLSSFEKSYSKLGYKMDLEPGSTPVPTGFYLIQNILQIYEFYLGEDGNIWRKYHSLPYFDYYNDDDNLEYEERALNFEYLPLIQASFLYNPDLGDNIWNNYRFGYFLFIGERRHMNTALERTNGKSEAIIVKENVVECKPMLAFCRARIKEGIEPLSGIFYRGTMFRYDDEGTLVGEFDLIPGGNFGTFYYFLNDLDKMYRNSNHVVTAPLRLSEKEIVTLRMTDIICIDNQPLLPDTLEYTVGQTDITINKFTFRMLRNYKDRES